MAGCVPRRRQHLPLDRPGPERLARLQGAIDPVRPDGLVQPLGQARAGFTCVHGLRVGAGRRDRNPVPGLQQSVPADVVAPQRWIKPSMIGGGGGAALRSESYA